MSKTCKKKNVNFSDKSDISNKRRDIPCSQMRKLNKIMPILPYYVQGEQQPVGFPACPAWYGRTAPELGQGWPGPQQCRTHSRPSTLQVGAEQKEGAPISWPHSPQQQVSGLEEKCRNPAPPRKKVLRLGVEGDQSGIQFLHHHQARSQSPQSHCWRIYTVFSTFYNILQSARDGPKDWLLVETGPSFKWKGRFECGLTLQGINPWELFPQYNDVCSLYDLMIVRTHSHSAMRFQQITSG